MVNQNEFFLGCAVFAYSGWKNILFEPHLAKDQYLQQYSKFFHSVEGNSFFMAYRIWKQSKSGKLKYLKTFICS